MDPTEQEGRDDAFAEDAEQQQPEGDGGAPQIEADEPEGDRPEAEESEQDAESELERAQRERDEYLNLAQRTRAELENYRRRVSGEAGAAELRGRSALARELIPAIDNLERALLAAGVAPEGAAPEDEPASREVSARTALAEGVALVYRELREGLERSGVEGFDPAGERFDPARHEAVSSAPRDGVDPGIVVETLEKGYVIGEQVLRPARVVVSG